MTEEQKQAIINYLKAQKAFDVSLKTAKKGYSANLLTAVKTATVELKKLFSGEEVDCLTSAAYQPDLMAHFLV